MDSVSTSEVVRSSDKYDENKIMTAGKILRGVHLDMIN